MAQKWLGNVSWIFHSKPNLEIYLDENLGQDCARLFIDAGHDSTTVLGQGLAGSSDSDLIMHCRAEGRALVTLDLDFANPLVFKPSAHHGIAVLRPPSPVTPEHLKFLCITVLDGLSRETLDRHLWIVELGRIRIYQEQSE